MTSGEAPQGAAPAAGSPNWKNVNNWHWIEKDCTEWAHAHLREALPAVVATEAGQEAGGATTTTTTYVATVARVTSIEGEVSVNVRKGRIRQIYDLTIAMTIRLAASPPAGGPPATVSEYEATVVDYMSDTEEGAFELLQKEYGAATRAVRDALRRHLWVALGAFRERLAALHGESLLVAQSARDEAAGAHAEALAQEISKAQGAGGGRDEQARALAGDAQQARRASIEQTVDIDAPLEAVYDALTRTDQMMAWSRGTAKVATASGARPAAALAVGTSFSLLGGNIQCAITALAPPSSPAEGGRAAQLDMTWRLASWPAEAPPSTVTIRLQPGAKGADPQRCTVALTQAGVPSGDADVVRSNWQRYYWEPIRVILGCAQSPAMG